MILIQLKGMAHMASQFFVNVFQVIPSLIFTKYRKKRGLTLIKFNLFIKRGNQNEKKKNLGCPSTTSFQENKKVENEVHNDLLIAIESLNKIH